MNFQIVDQRDRRTIFPQMKYVMHLLIGQSGVIQNIDGHAFFQGLVPIIPNFGLSAPQRIRNIRDFKRVSFIQIVTFIRRQRFAVQNRTVARTDIFNCAM